MRLARQGQENEFVTRYGDSGEDEFDGRGGTIPQRLLMMNGKLIREKIKDDPINASTRIAMMAGSPPRLANTFPVRPIWFYFEAKRNVITAASKGSSWYETAASAKPNPCSNWRIQTTERWCDHFPPRQRAPRASGDDKPGIAARIFKIAASSPTKIASPTRK